MTDLLAQECLRFSSELAEELEIVVQVLEQAGSPSERLLRTVREYVDVAHAFLLNFCGRPVWELDGGASVARVTCNEEDLKSLALQVRTNSMSVT